jgi:hypothetical protein
MRDAPQIHNFSVKSGNPRNSRFRAEVDYPSGAAFSRHAATSGRIAPPTKVFDLMSISK